VFQHFYSLFFVSKCQDIKSQRVVVAYVDAASAIGALRLNDPLTALADHVEHLHFRTDIFAFHAEGAVVMIVLDAQQSILAQQRVDTTQRTQMSAPRVFQYKQIKVMKDFILEQ